MRSFTQFLYSSLLLNEQVRAVSSYDYVIIGGGTAGLTVAARLTENPYVSVLVLEAGFDHSNDIKVLCPGLFTSMYGDPEYDWNYKTIPQIHATGKVVASPRGKQLGGSSAINLLFWTHASQQDINNWGDLGNADWSWDALDPYYSKSESFVASSKLVAHDLETRYIEPSSNGKKGPIINSFPDIYGPFAEAWSKTWDTLGFHMKTDPRDGLAVGGYTNLLNLDLRTRTRTYAVTAYYLPAKDRPNLTVMTGALVSKILFAKNRKSGVPVADGVLYNAGNGTVTVKAKREVILSAGTIGSPQILELSGIGNPILLKKLVIKVVFGNPNVGENLQDHAYIPLGFEVIPGVTTSDNLTNPTYFAAALLAYTTNHTGPLAGPGATSALLSCTQINCNLTARPPTSSPLAVGLKEQYALLAKYFATEAITQISTFGGAMSPQFSSDLSKLPGTRLPGNFFTMAGVLQHPHSRGNSHINSANASVYPTIDPNYLSHPFDIEVLSAILLHNQVIATTKPLSDLLKGNGTVFQEGYYKLDASNVKAWITASVQSLFHLCGTNSMLPEKNGGVVDARSNVYGVDRLRVVDASVFSMIPRANLQTLVYAIAERAADFIKADADL